jgi:hypothetical protein
MYDGLLMLRDAAIRHGIHLSVLVADTGLWASPEVHRHLIRENAIGAFFPNTRRYRESAGEQCQTQPSERARGRIARALTGRYPARWGIYRQRRA